MSKINWDKAPDWATHGVHYGASGVLFFNEDHYYQVNRDATHGINGSFFGELMDGAEERPTNDHDKQVESYIPIQGNVNDLHKGETVWVMADGFEETKGIACTSHWYWNNACDTVILKVSERPDDTIKDAPKEWSGEGLPPVGTVCEIMRNQRNVPVEIVMYRGNSVVIEYFCGKMIEVCNCDEVSFIAQDNRTEKEKAIDEMMNVCDVSKIMRDEGSYSYRVIEKLYDAGYRRYHIIPKSDHRG